MLRGLAGFGAAFGIAGLLLPRVARARVCEKPAVGTLLGIYPVGAIYISTVNTNPNALFGFGTWERFGNGRALVGVNESDANFNPVMQTGGSATHALTAAQMPRHTHVQNSHNHRLWLTHQTSASGHQNRNQAPGRDNNENNRAWSATDASETITATNQHTGGTGTAQSASNGGAHNNLQPYITVFIWRRTA